VEYKGFKKSVTDRHTDRQTDKVIHRGAPLLKNKCHVFSDKSGEKRKLLAENGKFNTGKWQRLFYIGSNEKTILNLSDRLCQLPSSSVHLSNGRKVSITFLNAFF